MSQDDKAQSTALALLALGMITPHQAAALAGVSRQLVAYWLRHAGIDWRTRQRQYLKTLWSAELRRARMIAKGVKPKRRTKREVREQTSALVLDFLERGGKIKRARRL